MDQTPRRRLRRIPRPDPSRQGVFGFVARTERLNRIFKIAIVGMTLAVMAALFAAWRIHRMHDIENARDGLARAFVKYTPAQRRLLRFAGMDPEHVLLRRENFNRLLVLPSTVFEADESGRSYRFRPNFRSIWVGGFPGQGGAKPFFQVPDTPETAGMVRGTGAKIIAGSGQGTNSWGLRGPEPDLKAPVRGLVLGDSYMQGLFVGDDQTPVECLKRDLAGRLGAPVEILNTGHLGYSPEQYEATLDEYAGRFHPQFVVVSIFANDFAGDVNTVLEGKGGDWKQGKYWLDRIRQSCASRGLVCLYVPVPWVNQITGPRRAGFYPGAVSNLLEVTGVEYLDPTDDFTNEYLRGFIVDGGAPRASRNPLFNGHIGDGHFSARGCEIWAEAVGTRLALLIGPLRRKSSAGGDAAGGPSPAPRDARSGQAPYLMMPAPVTRATPTLEFDRLTTKSLSEVTVDVP